MNAFCYDFPIGPVCIGEADGHIIRIGFGRDIPEGYVSNETPPIRDAAAQLCEYFDGKRLAFDFPIRYTGSGFQQKVWDALKKIPAGETRSYKDIAESIGEPRAYRAVGMANRMNPLAILIPCHRVVAHGGGLGGYAGGLPAKQWLLDMEKRYKR
jgi:methylated-DNA-[protein]-cysteine S-methyltransferase